LYRSFVGKKVYINNKLYPIVGKMAMDNTSVKVDNTVKNGDTVYFFRDFKHACTFIDDASDVANVIATIANLSVVRVPRVAVKKFNK
jgi:alanine racemase